MSDTMSLDRRFWELFHDNKEVDIGGIPPSGTLVCPSLIPLKVINAGS